jgi:hypothetical protein
MENCMCEAGARSAIGTSTPVKALSPSIIFLKVTRSFLVSAIPSIERVDEAEPSCDISKEVMDMPRGRRAAMLKTIGDKGGDTEKDIADAIDPADARPAVTAAVSVAMLLAADWALAAADFSARLESRYDGKMNTVATKMAKDTKKRRTMKNLTRYSVFRVLIVFGGRRAWYMDFIQRCFGKANPAATEYSSDSSWVIGGI